MKMNMIFSLVYILTAAVIFIVIPVLIGTYVYRDATRRGMNANLWTLIAVLAPTFIGLIVYLIVRADHSDLQCPNCEGPVTEKFALCPHCGKPLKSKCAKCDNPLDPTWTNCPNCGELVPEELKVPLVAAHKDKSLGKILLAVILIPLVMMLVLIIGLVSFRGANNSSVSTATGMRVEDFADNKVVTEWLKTCEAQGEGTCVLAYENDVSIGQREQSYVIFHRNGLTIYGEPWVMVTPKKLFKQATIVVGYQADTPTTQDYVLQQVEYFGGQANLEIYEDGQTVNYYLEVTDTPITFAQINLLIDNATNLYAARMEYLGDNSGVINLIDETGLSGIGPYTIELETEKPPYGLRIIFDSVPKDFEMIDFSTYAIELLGLIKNLDYVEITDGENTYTLTTEKATQTLGFDVKQLGQSQAKLEDYLRSLQEIIND